MVCLVGNGWMRGLCQKEGCVRESFGYTGNDKGEFLINWGIFDVRCL